MARRSLIRNWIMRPFWEQEKTMKRMRSNTKFDVPVGKCGCRFVVRYGIRRIEHRIECPKALRHKKESE